MNTPGFNYSTGKVTINVAVPQSLLGEKNLNKFYADPNADLWGAELCRLLYHESSHFWQFLSSSYLVDLVGEEWNRIVTFEEKGEIIPRTKKSKAYNERQGSNSFAPSELVECWARYWDVQSRGPQRIIQEEDIDTDDKDVLVRTQVYNNIKEYSWLAFDAVMQKGKDCAKYASPYRWMLQNAQQPITKVISQRTNLTQDAIDSVTSYVVALTFPILSFAALGSPNPMEVFYRAFQRILQTEQIIWDLISHNSTNINFDWLNQWNYVWGEIIRPVMTEFNLPLFTSGLESITDSYLGSHPIYGMYFINLAEMRNTIMIDHTSKEHLKETNSLSPEQWPLADLAAKNIWIVFALPGQPIYRYLLGQHFSPPEVEFENKSIFCNDDFRSSMIDLGKREQRFRAAEYAVSQGLSPHTFET